MKHWIYFYQLNKRVLRGTCTKMAYLLMRRHLGAIADLINMSSYTINGVVNFLSSSGKERTPITIDMSDGGQVDVSPFNGVIPPSLKVCLCSFFCVEGLF